MLNTNQRHYIRMVEDNQKFCVKCGAPLSADDKFCSGCGARVPGRNPEQVAAEKDAINQMVSKRLIWPAILMLIYAIPFLIIGIYFLVDSEGIVNMLMDDSNWAELGLSYDETVDMVDFWTVAYLASSVCGIASAAMCLTRRFYWAAIVLCFISMFTGAAGFLALLFGLFAFWQILVSKMSFKEYSDELEAELNRIQ